MALTDRKTRTEQERGFSRPKAHTTEAREQALSPRIQFGFMSREYTVSRCQSRVPWTGGSAPDTAAHEAGCSVPRSRNPEPPCKKPAREAEDPLDA